MAQTLVNAPTIAIDLRAELFEHIRKLSPKDGDAWKKLLAQVNAGERSYIIQIRTALEDLSNEGKKVCLVYNHKVSDAAVIYF